MQSQSARDASPAGTAQIGLRPVLLCLSHLRWNFVFQRPQHLMVRAARRYSVLFFEEPLHETAATPHLRTTRPHPGVTVATPVLPHGLTHDETCRWQRTLLDDLLADEGVPTERQKSELIVWYYTPMALEFSAHLDPRVALYDCMDELSQFHGAPAALCDLERRLIARVDLMFTGGVSLFEAKRRLHANVHAFPSSIDAAHFGQARQAGMQDPADQAAIPRKRIGFFGVIDERLDTDLLAGLARLRPDWHFVVLGPTVKIDPASLPLDPNIHWLGQKSYGELPAYLAGWDAGFMPFALNEATRFISPTKTPEFLSAGLPVVSTAVPDVVSTYGARGLVAIGTDAADFAAKLDAEMSKPREARLRDVDAFLSGMSWDRTWSEMDALIASGGERAADGPSDRASRASANAAHV